MEPGEIRLTSTEQAGDSIHQDAKGRLAKLTAGVAKRQRPLHPAVAFVAGAAMGALAPQHAEAQRSLGTMVCRVDTMFAQNTHSDAISRCKRLAKRPASSWRAW